MTLLSGHIYLYNYFFYLSFFTNYNKKFSPDLIVRAFLFPGAGEAMRMTIKTPEGASWLAIAITLLAAAFGSIAKYSYRVLGGDKFSIAVLFLQLIISLFAGMLVIAIASYFEWNAEAAGGIAGLAGWSGAEFIKAAEARLNDRVKGG